MLGGLFKKNKNNNNKLSFFTDTEHVDFNLRNLSCLRIYFKCVHHISWNCIPETDVVVLTYNGRLLATLVPTVANKSFFHHLKITRDKNI